MWDTLDPSFDAQKREEGLKVEFRKIMTRIPHGTSRTTVERFFNNSDSAWSIVDNAVKENDQQGVSSGKKKYSLRSLVLMILGSLRLLKKSGTQDSS